MAHLFSVSVSDDGAFTIVNQCCLCSGVTVQSLQMWGHRFGPLYLEYSIFVGWQLQKCCCWS